MIYSATYLAQMAQFLSFGLTLININIDPGSIETTLSVILTVVSGVMVLVGRYRASHDVTLTGFYRK